MYCVSFWGGNENIRSARESSKEAGRREENRYILVVTGRMKKVPVGGSGSTLRCIKQVVIGWQT